MKPLATDVYPVEFGRFRDIFDPEVYDKDFHLYLDGASPAVIDIVSKMTPADRQRYYEFFLLLRAVQAGTEATMRTPQKLIIHSFKECQLKCTYCIVEQDKLTGEKLDIDIIKKLRDTYAINSVHFVGGEPTFDWKHFYGVLDALGPMMNISLTTNGLGLTQAHLDELEARCQDVSYHVSVEPTSWGTRLFNDGVTHQNEILKKVFTKLNPAQVFKSPTSCVNLVLPMEYYGKGLQTSMDVDRITEELSDVLNYQDWMGQWHVEFVLEGNQTRTLDDWIIRLMQDETAMAVSGRMAKQRFMQGPLGEVVFRARRKFGLNMNKQFPGLLFGCTVGGSSIHVSFNGQLYGCSVEAGRGEGTPIAPDAYSPAAKWSSVCDVLPSLTYDVCKACPAKYTCGKTCGKLNVATCEFTRLRSEMRPRILKRFDPEEYAAVQRAQERYILIFHQNRALFEQILTDPWTRQFMLGQTNDLTKIREASDALGVLMS